MTKARLPTETETYTFKRSQFLRDFEYIRKDRKKTGKEVASEAGISYQMYINATSRMDRQEWRSIVYLAFWGEINLNDYIEILPTRQSHSKPRTEDLPLFSYHPTGRGK